MSRQNEGLKLIGVPVEPDLHAAIKAFSVGDGSKKPLPLAAACRKLLRVALEGEGAELIARDLESEGYNDGLRRGLHEARTAIRAALQDLWQGGE